MKELFIKVAESLLLTVIAAISEALCQLIRDFLSSEQWTSEYQ